MEKILYTPELTYKKNYDTDGTVQIPSTVDTSVNTSTVDDTTVPSIKDNLSNIESALAGTPSDINNAMQSPIAGINYVLNNLTLPSYDPDAKEVSVVISDTQTASTGTPSSSDSEYPDLFPDTDNTLTITVDTKGIGDLVDNDFTGDIADIFNDFSNNMQQKLADYYSGLIAICSEAGITDFSVLNKKYEGSTANIKDGLKHVSDSIIKSQIIKDQKLRLFKKMFDIDNMIAHIRACKVSSELKKRYYSTDFIESSNLMDIVQNRLLSDVRMETDKKYKENLFNLYKYLNSSVILINECLNMNLKEAQGKALLISREGITL